MASSSRLIAAAYFFFCYASARTLMEQEPHLPNLEPEFHMPHWPGEVPKLHIPELPIPKFHMPQVHIPEVHMPKVHLPEVNMPEVHLPSMEKQELTSSMKACPTNFSKVDYTAVTSVCKGPSYDERSCCSAFAELACKYSSQVNDFSSTCPIEFLSFLSLAGDYPHGVFVNRCTTEKRLCP